MAVTEPSDALKRIAVPLRLTQAGLWAERLVHAFWPLSTLILAVLAALAFGVQDFLTFDAFWAGAVVVTLVAVWAMAHGLRTFRKPSRAEAISRLDSHLPGHPLSALTDHQAIGGDDPASLAVWRTHLQRMADRAAQAKPVTPDLRLAARDPYALRYVALTAFVMALMFGSLWRVTSVAALAPGGAGGLAAGPSWEGWAQPPAYTGKPAIYLNEVSAETLALPVGTRFQFRLYGEVGALSLSETVSGDAAPPPPAEDANILSREFVMNGSGSIEISGASGRSWAFTALPDILPQIRGEGPMGREADGRFKQKFAASDDYGVVAGRVEISLDLAATDRRYGLATDPDPRQPVVLDLPMPVAGHRVEFTETLIDDLSKHLFANLPVKMVFTAVDAAGQEGQSEPLAVTLPGRRFFDPLAAALVEMRRDLLWSATNAGRAAQVLKAVSNRPDGFFRKESAYLRLRAAIRQLDAQGKTLTATQRDEVAEELWQIALMLEEGDLASAFERLQRAQDRLDQAIRNGASPEEIDDLMKEMREALDDYMRQLAEEAQRNPDSQLSQNMDGMQMSGDQLQEMLKELQKLMEEGRMAEAQELMEMLRQLMQNMQVVEGQGGQGQGQGNQAMRDLGDTLRDQQQLSDDAYRDMQEGQQGQQGQPNGDDLAKRQGELRDRLGQIGRSPLPGPDSEQGDAARKELDRAGRAMREAEDALREGDLPGALDRQADAIEALREGMRNLGEALAQEQRQQGDNQQSDNTGATDPSKNRDPLGREPGESARIGSDQNMLQGEEVYRRAQDLLDEIRRRTGDPSRPNAELDYLRRLLDMF